MEYRVYKNQVRNCYANPCALYCQPPQCQVPPGTPPAIFDPSYIQNIILNRPLSYVSTIYPDIRVILENGIRLDTENNLRSNRINVAVKNGIVTEFLGIY